MPVLLGMEVHSSMKLICYPFFNGDQVNTRSLNWPCHVCVFLVYGPGIPRISSQTGSFVGAIRINSADFDIPEQQKVPWDDDSSYEPEENDRTFHGPLRYPKKHYMKPKSRPSPTNLTHPYGRKQAMQIALASYLFASEWLSAIFGR